MSKRSRKIDKPFWQTKPCPSWCEGLHHDRDVDDRRSHVWESTENGVVLTTHNPVNYRNSQETAPTTLWVSLEQNYREVEPRVNIQQGLGTPEEQVDLYLTPREAERLAKRLLRAVRLAGGAL